MITGLLAVIGLHLVGTLVVLGFVLGVSWLITWVTGLVWAETAVVFVICLIWAVVMRRLFMAGFGMMLGFLAIGSLTAFVGGWLLSLWLPFSFLHTSLLLLGVTFALLYYLFADFREIHEELGEDLFDEDGEEMPIPQARFMGNGAEQTGEVFFRYIVANSICRQMNQNLSVRGRMNDTEVQELSIRLADAVVFVFRRKPVHTLRYQVTVSGLRGAFNKMGQRPYDADILELAVVTVNEALMTDPDLAVIARDRRWDKPFEEDGGGN